MFQEQRRSHADDETVPEEDRSEGGRAWITSGGAKATMVPRSTGSPMMSPSSKSRAWEDSKTMSSPATIWDPVM